MSTNHGFLKYRDKFQIKFEHMSLNGIDSLRSNTDWLKHTSLIE